MALVVARLEGDDDEVEDAVAAIEDAYAAETARGTVDQVGVGGRPRSSTRSATSIEKDLAKAESIAVPLTLVLLVLVFGGVVAASLPLVIGALSGDRHVPRPLS